MSAEGIFKLIANDGKTDRMVIVDDKGWPRFLCPSGLFEKRINSFSRATECAGQPTTPTLIDLEQDANRRARKK